jgi:hypothetical protein
MAAAASTTQTGRQAAAHQGLDPGDRALWNAELASERSTHPSQEHPLIAGDGLRHIDAELAGLVPTFGGDPIAACFLRRKAELAELEERRHATSIA